MPKTSLRGDQLTAEGLHCIMLPVIPYSSGRAKEVSFASGVSWMSDGELGTPKLPKVANIFDYWKYVCIYTIQ